MCKQIILITLTIFFTITATQEVTDKPISDKCGGCGTGLAPGTIQEACPREVPSSCVRYVNCSSLVTGNRRSYRYHSRGGLCPQSYQCTKTVYRCCAEAATIYPPRPRTYRSRYRPGSLGGGYRWFAFPNGLPTTIPPTHTTGGVKRDRITCKVLKWTNWSEWSNCTATCGGERCGVISRWRTCTDTGVRRCRYRREYERKRCGSIEPCKNVPFNCGFWLRRTKCNRPECCFRHEMKGDKCVIRTKMDLGTNNI